MAGTASDAQAPNKLYYGDNLEILRQFVQSESADLIYVDPPFNPNRLHEVRDDSDERSAVQIEGFDDTWGWGKAVELAYAELIDNVNEVALARALKAARAILGESELLAFLTMMAARIIELRRVLSCTGSIFMHCDPAASQHLRVIADAIFGAQNFRNEIIWQRTPVKLPTARSLTSNHDVILAYAKSDETVWNEQALFQSHNANDLDSAAVAKYPHRDADGRRYQLASLASPMRDRPSLTYEFLGVTRVWRWTMERMQKAYEEGLIFQSAPGREPRLKRYLDEQGRKPLGDVWTDISPLNSGAKERLGYPTQKPLRLLDRIIEIASKPGDLVLDPFAGSGSTIDAAQRLDRRWIGIDITMLAVDLIDKRLKYNYSENVTQTYQILGTPRDLQGARALLQRSPFDFERWCVVLVGGQPNEIQVGDPGIDGIIRIPTDTKESSHRVLISVKSGSIYPGHVRDLLRTVEIQHAAIGLLVCLQAPTVVMQDVASHAGTYIYPLNEQQYPRIQIISVRELLEGVRPLLPPSLLPYVQARPKL